MKLVFNRQILLKMCLFYEVLQSQKYYLPSNHCYNYISLFPKKLCLRKNSKNQLLLSSIHCINKLLLNFFSFHKIVTDLLFPMLYNYITYLNIGGIT